MPSSRPVDAPASGQVRRDQRYFSTMKDDQADSQQDVGEKLTRLPRTGDQ